MGEIDDEQTKPCPGLKGALGLRSFRSFSQITAHHNFSLCPTDYGAGDKT